MTGLSPQVPVPAPRNIHKSSQDSDTPAQVSPPEEKVEKGHEDSDRTEKIGGSGGPGGRWDITTGPGARPQSRERVGDGRKSHLRLRPRLLRAAN
jgi:hypothetical protein